MITEDAYKKLYEGKAWESVTTSNTMSGMTTLMKGNTVAEKDATQFNRVTLVKGDRVIKKDAYEKPGKVGIYKGLDDFNEGKVVVRWEGSAWDDTVIKDAIEFYPLTVKEIRKKYGLSKKQYVALRNHIDQLNWR